MPCEPLNLPGGHLAIAYSRGRRQRCSACKRHVADRLCDMLVDVTGRRGTMRRACNKPICSQCSVRLDAATDICPAHQLSDDALAAAAAFGARR